MHLDRDSKKFYQFIILYLLIYSCNSVYQNFAPIYLNGIGFSGTAIGTLMAVGPFIAIVAQPVWGIAGDRAKTKNQVLRLLLAGTALAVLIYPLSSSFYYLLAVIALYTFFQTSIIPVSDAITLEYGETKSWKFGHIRMAGTIGFAITAVIAGWLAKNNIKDIFFFLFPLFSLGAYICTLVIPSVKGHQSELGKMSIWELFKLKRLMVYTSFNLAIQITFGYYYAFFPIYYKQLGASNLMIGWSSFIAAFSEIPFLFFADRIYKKIGIGKMLTGAGIIAALRWMFLYLTGSPALILGLQVMHGLMFIVVQFSMATFINKEVPKELKASGQTLSGLVGLGISRIIGSLAGGYLSDIAGVRTVFLYNSLLAFAIVIIFAFAVLKRNDTKVLSSK